MTRTYSPQRLNELAKQYAHRLGLQVSQLIVDDGPPSPMVTVEWRHLQRLLDELDELRDSEAGYSREVRLRLNPPDEAPVPHPTPKQRLHEHTVEYHGDPPAGATTEAALSRWHARQHFRFAANHRHAGPNAGPSQRPPGWYTGEDPVPT